MDIKTVAKLAEIIDKYGLTKIDITDTSVRYLIEKECAYPVVHTAAAIPVSAPAAPADETVPDEEPRSVNGTVQKSSLVGTVYLAPQEGRDPFVSVGSEVKKGDTVCIIESMKMLNEIPAERDGRITAVLVSNEETVEYGQGLFVIE